MNKLKLISWQKNWKIFLAMMALAFIFFGNSIPGQFLYDDPWVILRNPTVQKFSEIFHQLILPYHYLQPETGLYRPLTMISYTFNYIFGSNPASFHVVNILVHALNSFLLFILIMELFGRAYAEKGKTVFIRRLAYISSFLFLLMPIHVEAVSSIIGRADLLSFAFSLMALILIVRKRYWLSSFVFLAALFSKESAIGIVPVIVFVIWLMEKRGLWPAVKRSFIYIPTGAVYVLLRYIALRSNFLSNDADIIYNPLKFTDALSRFYTALKVMVLYLVKTITPLRLSADYSFNQIPVIHTPFNVYVIWGVVILIGIVFLALWRKSRADILGFASVFFIFSYFVISNFIFPIGTIMAERTFYMSSAAMAIAAGAGLGLLMSWKFKKVWLAAFTILLSIYGLAIINRNRIWLNSGDFFKQMVTDAPESAHAKANLGVYYIQKNMWSEGKILIDEAYSVAPEHLPVLDSLGIIAEHEKRYGDAEKWYLKALELRPHYATALSNLGRMYFQLGRYEQAADVYWREFLHTPKPNFLLIYAMSKSQLGQYDEAISKIKQYYGENPKDIYLKFALGYAYYKKGDKTTADKYFKESKNPAISDEEFIKSLDKF